MATEQELRKEIERLTSRVQELEAQEVEIQERVVQKAISGDPGLKFNRLFILVCSA